MKARNTLFVALLTILLLGAGYWVAQNVNLMPAEGSNRAVLVDQLFRVMLGIAAVVFLLVEGVLLYSVLRFRRREGDEGDAVSVHGNRSLEIVWTLIPTLIVIVIGFYSFNVLAASDAPAAHPLVVNVRSRQYSWLFEYPAEGVTSSDLYLPLGRPVRFLITSEDVIHSFWVPEFRVKRDATPGQTAELVVTPTRLGTYPIRCAELCGVGHAAMGLSSRAIVESPKDFQKWVNQSKAASNDPVTLFATLGCNACHTLAAAKSMGVAGPPLDGIGQRAATRVPGTSAEDYIRTSIVKPGDFVVPGYADNVMPRDFGQRLSSDQLKALVEFLLAQ